MDSRIIIVLSASAFILLLLVFLFGFVYKYQKKTISFIKEKELLQAKFEQVLLQSQIEVQENTYRQIAQELHDNIGQLLSTTKMLIGVTEYKLTEVPDPLRKANATVTTAIHELRSLARSLDKNWLQQFNFLDNLRTEIERINAGEVIKAAILNYVEINKRPEEQVVLFRIVQEAIQNAIKHAQPSWINITVAIDKELIVEIRNDGKPLPENFQGMGTKNMQVRSNLLGGNITWQSAPGQTIVIVRLPF